MVNVPKTPVSIVPVGVVVSDFKECSRTYDYNSESMIYMREDLTDALIGLECFSHIHVIYYQHRRKDWLRLVEGEKDEQPIVFSSPGEMTLQGIYTTRSPSRPSAMGSCVAEMVKREGNRIYVKGLDALDGSPVMDIKVYIPQYDAFPLAEAPLNCCMGNELISTSRRMHWDTINVGLALGLRTGTKALQALSLARGEALEAEVVGEHFFAQGIEGATGCSILRSSMIFKELHTSPGKWSLKLVGNQGEVIIRLKDYIYAGAGEVLEADEDTIFASVQKD